MAPINGVVARRHVVAGEKVAPEQLGEPPMIELHLRHMPGGKFTDHVFGAMKEKDILRLSRPGFTVHFHDTLEDFYLAEALEYITAWRQSTDDNPVGICGPIGPTEQLPLVARLVNELGLSLRSAHFWGMDEWVIDGEPVGFA